MTRIPLIVEPDRDDPECAEVMVDVSSSPLVTLPELVVTRRLL